MDGGNQVPGAAIRWSFANQSFRKSSNNSDALVVNGAFVNQTGAGVLNPSAFVRTPDYSLANSPVYFSNLRNPGMFTTDASILKRFYIGEKSRYIEARLEAENILNHANFGSIINDPDSPVFGGINGKYGTARDAGRYSLLLLTR